MTDSVCAELADALLDLEEEYRHDAREAPDADENTAYNEVGDQIRAIADEYSQGNLKRAEALVAALDDHTRFEFQTYAEEAAPHYF